MAEKALVLFSGGVDSTTCLALAIEKYGKENVVPLSIHYGQKHDKEVQAAEAILRHYGMQGMEIDLTPVFCAQQLLAARALGRGGARGLLCRAARREERCAGFDLCALPQRAVPVLCGEHCAVGGLLAACTTARTGMTRRARPIRIAARISSAAWTARSMRAAARRCTSRRRSLTRTRRRSWPRGCGWACPMS